jgi:glutamyl/glutaminyl-tRNA synthetase
MYDRACLGLTPAQVEVNIAAGKSHTIRLKVPAGKTTLKDLVRGYVQFDHSVIDDQVLATISDQKVTKCFLNMRFRC